MHDNNDNDNGLFHGGRLKSAPAVYGLHSR
jgi:hypothetical protein